MKVSDRDRGHAGAMGHRPSQRLACRHQVGREGARWPAEGAAAAVSRTGWRHAERAAIVEQEHSTAAAGAEALGRRHADAAAPPPPPPAPPRRRRAPAQRVRAVGAGDEREDEVVRARDLRGAAERGARYGARRERQRRRRARARGGGVAPAVDGAIDRERRRVTRARRELEDTDAAEHALLHEPRALGRRDAVRRGERGEVEGAGGDLAHADAVEARAAASSGSSTPPSRPSPSGTTPPPSGQSAAEWCCLPERRAGRLARWRAHSSCRPPWPSAPIRPEPQLNAAPPSLSASVAARRSTPAAPRGPRARRRARTATAAHLALAVVAGAEDAERWRPQDAVHSCRAGAIFCVPHRFESTATRADRPLASQLFSARSRPRRPWPRRP